MNTPVYVPSGQVCGRARCVQLLGEVISRPECMDALANALREAFEKDPKEYFRTIIFPMLPVKVRRTIIDGKGHIVWSRLADHLDRKSVV